MATLRSLLAAFVVLAEAALATNYYVDCSSSTAGSGTQASPWNSLAQVNSPTFQAGDVISFRTGTTCNGLLSPKGSGTATSPITLTKYTSGSSTASPVINGGGGSFALRLTNQDYWHISNLAITNPAASVARRNGIFVTSNDGTAHQGINIDGNVVYQVAGQTNKKTNSTDFSLSCGIYVNATGTGSQINDVLIQNNEITDCGSGAIKVRGGAPEKIGSGIHVTRNTVDSCGGDGILVAWTDTPLVDYNTVGNLGKGKYPFVDGNFAGIWVLGTHDATMSHNVVFGSTMSAIDSEAFDCDWGNSGTCLVEYNYSHDNAGGAYLNCDGCGSYPGTVGGANQVVRYNIFQNDCRMYSNGDVPTLQFYQNVMYCDNKNFEIAVPKNTRFSNNIFVGNNNSTLPNRAGIQWFWNVFQNVPSPTNNGIPLDPQFVAPGHGGDTLDSAVGYKLKKTSPALANGEVIANNGGQDFWGDAVSSTAKPNRGAYEGPGL